MSKLIEKFEGLGWIGIWYLTNSTNINMPKTILEIYDDKLVLKDWPNVIEIEFKDLKYVKEIAGFLYLKRGLKIVTEDNSYDFWLKDNLQILRVLKNCGVNVLINSNRDRVLKASFKNSELILYASVDDFSPETCSFSIPYTVPIHVSAVGITLPWRCIGIDDKLVFSNWYQDGWKFTFVGKNVDRKLYLENLYLVGGLR